MSPKVYLCSLLCLSLSVCACSTINSVITGKTSDSTERKREPDIEAPPDLATNASKNGNDLQETAGGTTTYSDYQARKNTPNTRAKPRNSAGSEAAQETSAPREPEDEAVTESESTITVKGNSVDLWGKIRAFLHDAGYELESDDVQRPYVETSWKMGDKQRTRERYKISVTGDKANSQVKLVLSAEALRRQDGEVVWAPISSDQKHVTELAQKMQEAIDGN